VRSLQVMINFQLFHRSDQVSPSGPTDVMEKQLPSF
jgi:hypothetical protein